MIFHNRTDINVHQFKFAKIDTSFWQGRNCITHSKELFFPLYNKQVNFLRGKYRKKSKISFWLLIKSERCKYWIQLSSESMSCDESAIFFANLAFWVRKKNLKFPFLTLCFYASIFKHAVRFRVQAGRAELLRTKITGRRCRPPASKLFRILTLLFLVLFVI